MRGGECYRKTPPFDPHEILKTHDEAFDLLERLARQPLSPDLMRQIRRLCETTRERLGDTEPDFGTWNVWPSLADMCLRFETTRRGFLLFVAAHRRRDRTGEWPRRLDDLKLPILKDIRIDPYSGRDFVIRITPGEFRLYSVGTDEDDDGRRPAPGQSIILPLDDFTNGDRVFIPYQWPEQVPVKPLDKSTDEGR